MSSYFFFTETNTTSYQNKQLINTKSNQHQHQTQAVQFHKTSTREKGNLKQNPPNRFAIIYSKELPNCHLVTTKPQDTIMHAFKNKNKMKQIIFIPSGASNSSEFCRRSRLFRSFSRFLISRNNAKSSSLLSFILKPLSGALKLRFIARVGIKCKEPQLLFPPQSTKSELEKKP